VVAAAVAVQLLWCRAWWQRHGPKLRRSQIAPPERR
jgi:hypothetical protein